MVIGEGDKQDASGTLLPYNSGSVIATACSRSI